MNPREDISKNPITSPPADPLGLDAWAASCGIPVHLALALMASTLAGIAGDSCAPPRMTKIFRNNGLNLLGLHDDPFMTAALGVLVGDAGKIQSELVNNSRNLPAALVDKVMYEPVVSDKNRGQLAPLAGPGDYDTFGSHEFRNFSLQGSRQPSHQELCYESLVRPWILMQGTLPENLAKSLSAFHDGTGFSAGCVERLPAGASAEGKRLGEILDCIEGVTVERTSGKSPTLANRRPVKISGVIFMTASDFKRVIAERREFLSSVIPVPSVIPEITSAPDLPRIHAFLSRYGDCVEWVISARRYRTPLSEWFSSEELIGEFHSRQLDFLHGLQSLAEPLRVAEAAKLPSLLAWALHLLASDRPLGRYIMEAVFDASRLILADAVKLLREHDQRDLVARRLKVARKIVNRLTRIGPCKRRELVRGFDQQALSLHEPVIVALLQLRILTESPDRVLDFGEAPLSRLQPSHLLDESP